MKLATRVRSAAMRRWSSARHLEKLRSKARKQRSREGTSPTVYYFHQVDDPYSHLTVQKFDQLRTRYNVTFRPFLVSNPDAQFQGDARHFSHWARQDALNVAADYGTTFDPTVETPTNEAILTANQRLAPNLETADFAAVATELGDALWRGQLFSDSDDTALGQQAVAQGNAKREALGHYQGAMFYFDGEWFWGVDRIRLLEKRLSAEGFDTASGPPCVPEPTPEVATGKNLDGILLEYFPSLRSPYTAIGHQRVLDLIDRTGVAVKVRPVMPMMMRGIPAPRAKQQYIIMDSGREGREYGSPFGRIVDPFGEPVKQAFALFPGAEALHSGMAFVTAYLQAAWFDGTDITRRAGLQQVVEQAGLDWDAVNQAAQGEDWEAVLASNLEALMGENLWGVPSFRVSGGNNTQPYACWGQDRIWRVATEIARRA